jgi:hypothetical protein
MHAWKWMRGWTYRCIRRPSVIYRRNRPRWSQCKSSGLEQKSSGFSSTSKVSFQTDPMHSLVNAGFSFSATQMYFGSINCQCCHMTQESVIQNEWNGMISWHKNKRALGLGRSGDCERPLSGIIISSFSWLQFFYNYHIVLDVYSSRGFFYNYQIVYISF